MTTQADIKLVIDQLDQIAYGDNDADAIESAITTLETLGNQVAKQAAVIERFRDTLEQLACLGNGDKHGNSTGNIIAEEALTIPTDSTQVLQEWLDEKLGEPIAFETSDYRLVHRTTRRDIVPLFEKPVLK